MKIKKVITCGCSFSDAETPFTWPYQLERYFGKSTDDHAKDKLVFEHLGLPAQGQDLIQKKAMLAMMESLKIYAPEEIAVIVMWSGTTRKGFYIDSHRRIQRLVRTLLKPDSIASTKQFADLKNKLYDKRVLTDKRGTVEYSEEGGWYITRQGMGDDISLDYYELTDTPYIHIHNSIENIIMLQNTCKANNVNFYQQFFMDAPYNDFEFAKEHQLVGYLFEQLDENTVLSKQGMYEYLKSNTLPTENEAKYFLGKEDNHPNTAGNKKWVDEVMLPRLKELGFFNE